MTPPLPRPRRSLRVLLIAAALAGAGVSFFLQAASVAGRAAAVLSRACGSSERFDCGSVLASRWGRIGGLPTATWGFAYFAFFALWYIVAGLPNRRGRWRHLLPLLVALVGGAVSLNFTYVLLFRLPAMCSWCLAAHALNAVLIVGTILAWPRSGAYPVEPPRPTLGQIGGVIGIGAALSLATVGFLTAWYYYLAAGVARGALLEAVNNPDYVVWRHESSRRVDLPVGKGDFGVGAANAPHTLVVFMDFECPHCREFEAAVTDLMHRYRGRLRVMFKHYPMSRACSPQLPAHQDVHRFACQAARAAEAARRAGTPQQAWKYRQLLFANVENFVQRPWTQLAAEAGIDARTFEAAFDDDATRERIAQDVALARSLELEGAGAMYLDGRRLTAWRVTTWDVQPRTDDLQTWRMWDRLLPDQEAPASSAR